MADYRNRFWISIILLVLFSFSAEAKDHNIVDYGAKPDGVTLNTSAIQKAIDQAHLEKGGRVIVPTGHFLTGSFTLKSNVELHLTSDAVLLSSTHFEHHKVVEGSYQRSIIMSSYQDNISITGSGTIDGQGLETALRTDSLFTAGVLDQKYYNHIEHRPRFYMRPMLIVFMKCTNIVIRDIHLIDGASWIQHYDRCENLTISGITVNSDAYWNNDGIDISDSKNVYLTDSHFDSSDDGICLKSHFDDEMLENVIIENCSVRSSASAVKFGTKSLGGFKNVTIKNIKVYDTFRSAIAIESVDGGDLENILIDSLEATNTGNAIFIKLGHREEDKKYATLKNVTIKNVKVQVAFERPDYAYNIRGPALAIFHNIFPSSITGLPGHDIENVRLENIEITYPGRGHKGMAYVPLTQLDNIPENAKIYPEFHMFGELPAWGFYVRHVNGLVMENVSLTIQNPDYRNAFILDDVKHVNINDTTINGDNKTNHVIIQNSTDVKIDSTLNPIIFK
ncbi:MAG: glycoside hydrolase family 28 protein [Saprospiraceae bacterium]|nr:glycoside hydrolase family 28 protein [Saprospiraceae bacterium]